MEIDASEIRPSLMYQHMIHCIVPRPIAWVSTVSEAGVANVAPFSFFSGVGSRPPSLMFCPANKRDGSPKDSLRNIQQNGEFVVNVVSAELSEQMNASSAEFGEEESEFDACGLTAVRSTCVRPPRVGESPVHFECRVLHVLNIGTGPGGANLVVGQIVHAHIDDRVLGPDQLVSPDLLQAIGRMGGLSYCHTSDRFELPRP